MKISTPAGSRPAIAGTPTPPPVQQDAANKVLLNEAGDRKVTLSRDAAGRITLMLAPPAVTQLVLSGGGAKGVAFPGAIKALEENNALQGVQSVSGSSAGAISAALLASGMTAQAFTELSNNLDLSSLMDSSNALTRWFQKAGSKIGNWLGKFSRHLQTATTVLPRLGTEAEKLEELVRSQTRATVLARIAESPSKADLPAVKAIADKLRAGGAVTFSDLHTLSPHIPAIKTLNITGTGTFEGRSQLVVFNTSLTPDMDVARAAHISAALPVVFKAPVEQGHGFQVDGERNAFQDGGLMLNTPVDGLYQRQFPDSPLSRPEQLILTFETIPLQSRGGYGSATADSALGVNFAANEQLNQARLKKGYADQTVQMPLKTEQGDYSSFFSGTVNFALPDEAKKGLQDNALKAVNGHLQQRALVRQEHKFASTEHAVLAMDDELLASVESSLAQDDASRDVLRFRREAKAMLAHVHQAITEANQAGDRLEITPRLASALRNLEALATHPAYSQWLAKQLNVPDNANFQQLLQVTAKLERGAVSRVMLGAVDEMKRRDVAVVAGHFIRDVIYPAMFRPGQPDANVELLRRAERDLGKARTPQDFNAVLDSITERYSAPDKLWDKPFSDNTLNRAKAWRMRV
ncbi:patatin-like phospholipase family protein [Pseudomonas tolaasii]|uniref:Patatin-like phospholipase family protein n=2 Tax=Pseudomonas tolaasii TaxID=29442 RepID=A0A7Y8DQ67_PSETO|nr:patatin-like phospholipase family protein [Pseudomonas tolaasii]ARB28160.1 type III secretion system effector protein exou [Pseudomonas tolaasii]KAB0476889.1 type III secretion system effector protein exou [Pseudomonas tolaasii]MBY8938599.1 patatin-like phospholipase family protein [Pseudomonas tolaasii]NWC20960.1 patatin-like phospholipase family protein [Pseudomonas tolaasii]NWC41399.1 patatin-like phospholipase family protein [Pseudomonas tolaasii]